jgi:hypothetical protein
MRWTPDRLARLRDQTVAAMVHLHDATATAPPGTRWRLGARIVGASLALGVGVVLWERAVAIAGAAPLRPLHGLWLELLRGMNDPELRVVEDAGPTP